MTSRFHRSPRWWCASLAALLPAIALAAAGGALELSGHGLALGVAGAAALLVEILVVQPAIDRRWPVTPDPAVRACAGFFGRRLPVHDAHDVALALAEAAREIVGVERTLLILPAASGQVEVLGAADLASQLTEAELAFQWLGEHRSPIDRAELRRLDPAAGVAAAGALLDRAGGDVVLPLVHRDVLIGAAILSAPQAPATPVARARIYRVLAAHAAATLANTWFDAGEADVESPASDPAAALRQAIAPDEVSGQVEVRGASLVAPGHGGDIWTCRDLGHDRLLVLVATASGPAPKPALVAAKALGLIDALQLVAGADLDPGRLLAALNRSIYSSVPRRFAMTAVAVVVDVGAKRVAWANAGQACPLVLSPGEAGSARIEPLVARGGRLEAPGETAGASYTRPLGAGERIVVLTSGVVEAGTPSLEPFGDKRVRAALMDHAATPAEELPQAILDAMREHVGAHAQVSDATVVTIALRADGEGPA